MPDPTNQGAAAVRPGAGVVASAHPRASEAGAHMLANGGNAFDAAVAVAAALNVVEPYMSGLTGMGFATMWVAAEQRVRVLDFVPPIPRSFPADRFQKRAELLSGPAAVGPPGNLAGWCKLRQTYGKLPLARVLQPAIRLADDGFSLSAFGVEELTTYAPIHAAAPGYGEAFGKAFPVSDSPAIHRPDLAATLRLIGEEGPDVFYRGALARRMIAWLTELGGTLTMEDLSEIGPVWREPISASYRGLQIHLPPPPCEGFQMLLTLRILEGFDVAGLGRESPEHLDLVIRATRLAAGIRIANNLPDPKQLAALLSEEAVIALRDRVRAGGGMHGPTEQWICEPAPGGDPGHTTSFSVADDAGNLICVTQSLGSVFGSGVVIPGTGLCLNNFLYWADVQPGSPNRAKPGM
ncbi:gamma-glutamyltransferase, partial [Acidisphaera sp. L21]|uniref:gamma-glutamyltransferase n=1 Tax=Acidisphaera sp. L21 TaxID=1641851 RepID=UPI00131E092D